MTTALREYRDATDIYEGYFAYPVGVRRAPCVLIAHDWSGLGAPSYDLADRISGLGFVAFAVDLYGKGKRGYTSQQSAALMQPLVDNRDLIHSRFSLALDVARRDSRVDPTSLVAIGHCFGGLCVLDMARRGAPLLGAISVHGVLSPPPQRTIGNIKTKILILHGNDDPLATSDDVHAIYQELSDAGADWQCHIFGHAMHAFTVQAADQPQNGLLYDANADMRSWQLIETFLHDVFVSR